MTDKVTPTPDTELMACPFCGNDEIEVIRYEHVAHIASWEVHCLSCTVSNTEGTKAEAITAWNRRIASTRPADSALRALVSEDAIYLTGAERDEDLAAIFVTVADVKRGRAALASEQPPRADALVEKRWTFDDGHIGRVCCARNACLETRDIPRPPGLTNAQWYQHARSVCAALASEDNLS